ncbi:hypothetical protein ACFV9D_24990 [Streptomyces sp. NPDC059875]|uniref:hypothetical protein n=1 Tax=unclassified Streptomyces TaxID=2593676 RepID=UPI00366589DA
MTLPLSRPAIVCRECPSEETELVLLSGRQALRCRLCRTTWRPYETPHSPAPDYRAAYRTAPPADEERETCLALQAGLDAAATTAKVARERGPDNETRRLLLLLRWAALADPGASGTDVRSDQGPLGALAEDG